MDSKSLKHQKKMRASGMLAATIWLSPEAMEILKKTVLQTGLTQSAVINKIILDLNPLSNGE